MLAQEKDASVSFKRVKWIPGVGDICYHQSGLSVTRHCKPTEVSEPASASSKTAHTHHHSPTSTRSALRRHCEFWDADGDGMIYPWDIFIGFRKLGFNIVLCMWAAVTMAICSSYATQRSWLPHPLFAINIDNIHSNRHGSTTTVYDLNADIDMRRFDAIFDKYAEGKSYLTIRTLYNVWAGQCCANDWFGWFAGALECESFIHVTLLKAHLLTVPRDCTIYSTLAR
jgi:hypothetical protein